MKFGTIPLKIALLTFAMVVSVSGLAACGDSSSNDGSSSESSPATYSSLDGRTFSSSKTADESVTVTFKGRQIGGGGCNSMGGKFTLEDGLLTAPALFSTQMMCPPKQAELENTLTQLLSNGATTELTDDELTLSDDSGGSLKLFETRSK